MMARIIRKALMDGVPSSVRVNSGEHLFVQAQEVEFEILLPPHVQKAQTDISTANYDGTQGFYRGQIRPQSNLGTIRAYLLSDAEHLRGHLHKCLIKIAGSGSVVVTAVIPGGDRIGDQ